MNHTLRQLTGTLFLIAGLAAGLTSFTGKTLAHCDTLDGPVAIEARAALAKGDVTPVLKWVKAEYEAEIREVFSHVLKARAEGPAAREIADRFFLETVIRVHRQGEGAPYTGLKPAGTVEPSVAAADQAVAAGSVEALANRLGEQAELAVRGKFTQLSDASKHKETSVAAGRDFVASYVAFVHFVEGLANLLQAAPEPHGDKPAASCGHHANQEGAVHEH